MAPPEAQISITNPVHFAANIWINGMKQLNISLLDYKIARGYSNTVRQYLPYNWATYAPLELIGKEA
ncbi:MAG: hypothetical protein IPO21_01305 [Bacteroidales bacterium]|nr:hypothetical protein [Bacteroidales bacterium]